MWSYKKYKVHYPVNGKQISIEKLKNKLYNKSILGPTYVFETTDNKIYAPFDGKILFVYNVKKNAIVIEEKNTNVHMLVLIGENTNDLKGKGFKNLVKKSDFVKKGDPLIEFDINILKNINDNKVIVIFFRESLSLYKIKKLFLTKKTTKVSNNDIFAIL